MPGPRRKFRERPKKTGAKKNAKVNAQKRRLVESGGDEEKVKKLSSKETRECLKKKSPKKDK